MVLFGTRALRVCAVAEALSVYNHQQSPSIRTPISPFPLFNLSISPYSSLSFNLSKRWRRHRRHRQKCLPLVQEITQNHSRCRTNYTKSSRIFPGQHIINYPPPLPAHFFLFSRFILNLPDEELSSLERVCFQVEQAYVPIQPLTTVHSLLTPLLPFHQTLVL